MWLTLFSALLKLALEVLRHLERKQQLDKARLEVAYELIRKADDMVNGIDLIVRDVSHDPADIVSDPANRDNRNEGGRGTSEKSSLPNGV